MCNLGLVTMDGIDEHPDEISPWSSPFSSDRRDLPLLFSLTSMSRMDSSVLVSVAISCPVFFSSSQRLTARPAVR